MKTYTEHEAKALAVEAAREAVAQVIDLAPVRPVPKFVSVKEAAAILEVSPRTVARMNLPRQGSRIPYSAVLRALSR